MDQTGENADSFGSLGEDSVNFDLSQAQSEQFSYLQGVNSHLRANYHALHDNLWWHATQEEDKSGNGEKKEGQKKSLRVMTLADMFPLVLVLGNDDDDDDGVGADDDGNNYYGDDDYADDGFFAPDSNKPAIRTSSPGVDSVAAWRSTRSPGISTSLLESKRRRQSECDVKIMS